ncbi:MAG: protein-export chaperone SecB [Proteobacteria bacterium]|nr:protein-export chaperone SecB [Pseudomonadota bacterium]
MAKKPTTDGAADENADAAPIAADQVPEQAVNEQPLAINAQYTKDLSFEAPGAPAIYGLMQQEAPDISVSVNVNVSPLQERTFEVILEIGAECKVKDQTAFIVELEYAGVFTLAVPEEHVQPILLIECPRLLFPFARNILADVTRDGGFPPLMLGPLDFASMYQAKMQGLESAMAAGADADADT